MFFNLSTFGDYFSDDDDKDVFLDIKSNISIFVISFNLNLQILFTIQCLTKNLKQLNILTVSRLLKTSYKQTY